MFKTDQEPATLALKATIKRGIEAGHKGSYQVICEGEPVRVRAMER